MYRKRLTWWQNKATALIHDRYRLFNIFRLISSRDRRCTISDYDVSQNVEAWRSPSVDGFLARTFINHKTMHATFVSKYICYSCCLPFTNIGIKIIRVPNSNTWALYLKLVGLLRPKQKQFPLNKVAACFRFKKYVTSDLDEADFGLENRPRIEIQNRKRYAEESEFEYENCER